MKRDEQISEMASRREESKREGVGERQSAVGIRFAGAFGLCDASHGPRDCGRGLVRDDGVADAWFRSALFSALSRSFQVPAALRLGRVNVS